ncbi:MAG: extracellular solute-binding protein [Patescibacteria group bacterium]
MLNKKNLKLAILGVFLLILPICGFSCTGGTTETVEIPKVNLTYWRVWDSSDKFSEIISAYEAKYPYVNITYRKLRYEELDQALLEAWARGTGPDILSIHNTWVDKYLSDIEPMPAEVSMQKTQMTGPSWRQRQEIVTQKKNMPTTNDVKTNFVDVVYDDIVRNGQIVALPLSIDSLVLFYNKDILNNAGIANPPLTWSDFNDMVKKLTVQDEKGNIIQAGAALGTANNIPRSMDILSLLMMQNGTQMMNGNSAAFNQPSASDKGYYPGKEALKFYTDFADPSKEVYTWNSSMADALEAFESGKVAFFFGYSFHLDDIKAKAPKLNIGVSTMPQIAGNLKQVNYANYWVETVTKKSTHQPEAWDFIAFATAQENVSSYLKKAKRPTALKALINSQLGDLELAPFAKQTLTADSWYHGSNFEYTEDAFKDMINKVNNGSTDYQGILDGAATKIRGGIY